MSLEFAGAVGKLAYKAYKRDRSNWYVLTDSVVLPPVVGLEEPMRDFVSPLFLIDGAEQQIMLMRGYGWNGADLFLDRGLLLASAVHDAFYGNLERIAEEWGWSESAVRKLADDLFNSLAYRGKKGIYRAVKRVVYNVLRIGGGIYHKARLPVLVLAMSMALSGCLTPPRDMFGGADMPEIHYEKTN